MRWRTDESPAASVVKTESIVLIAMVLTVAEPIRWSPPDRTSIVGSLTYILIHGGAPVFDST